MTDYSTYRRCQWIVSHHQASLWDETERPTILRALCRNQARLKLGEWTWLCRQHARKAQSLEPMAILTSIVQVAGRPDGQL